MYFLDCLGQTNRSIDFVTLQRPQPEKENHVYSKNQGGISWVDLTAENAGVVRDFYAEVVGLIPQDIPMDGYNDFVMTSPTDADAAVGICHAKGPNKEMPPQWLVYFNVDDVEQALIKCQNSGGKVLREMTDMGSFEFGVLQDPAGAIAGVIKSKSDS